MLSKNIGELELMSVGLDDQRCHRPVVESRNIHTVMPDDEGVVIVTVTVVVLGPTELSLDGLS